MTAGELKERGSSFITRGLIAVVLIQFFILPVPPQEDRELSGFITEGLQRFRHERDELKDRLECEAALNNLFGAQQSNRTALVRVVTQEDIKRLSYERDEFKGLRKCNAALNILKAQESATALGRKVPEETLVTWFSLAKAVDREKSVDQLTKMELGLVALAKARTRRELKIPGTDSAIDERDIRRFYPAAIAIFATLILGFRRAVTAAATRDRDLFVPPYWAAPFPYTGKMPFGLFLALNSLGIMLLAALFYVYLQFMYRDDVFQRVSVFVLNAGAGLIALAMLLDAIGDALMRTVKTVKND
jgi:hypothetical protein